MPTYQTRITIRLLPNVQGEKFTMIMVPSEHQAMVLMEFHVSWIRIRALYICDRLQENRAQRGPDEK